MSLEYIASEKGKRKVCDEQNYLYEKHQDNPKKTKTYWRCEKFYEGCTARIHTACNCDKLEIIFRSVGGHSHPASSAKIEARICGNYARRFKKFLPSFLPKVPLSRPFWGYLLALWFPLYF